MGKKRKGEKDTKTKRQSQYCRRPVVGNPSRSRMIDVMIFVLGAVATIGLAFFGVLYTRHVVPSIWIMFGCIVFFALAGCLYWQKSVSVEKKNFPFSVAMEFTIIGMTRNEGQFGAVIPPNRFTPVPLATMVRIVNQQNHPAEIDRFTLEVQRTKGKFIFSPSWIMGVPIPSTAQLVTLGDPPSRSVRIEPIGKSLSEIFAEGPLAAHQTVRGWFLCDFPADYDSAIKPQVFKITIRDTEGHQYSKILTPESRDFNEGPSAAIQFRGLFDLTGYQNIHWADLAPK